MHRLKRLQRWGWTAFLHSFATIMIGILLGLPSIDGTRLQMLWHSYTSQGMALDWATVALHFALAGCVWALMVIGYRLVRLRRTERKQTKRVMLSKRGTILTETLIIIVPFLLLTSGIAQLTQLLVTGLLADLAVFQAARAVFVWAPETTQPRFESSFGDIIIQDRARTAASMALAPTAPNDYYVGRIPVVGSSDYFRRQRNIMSGAFRPGDPNSNWIWSASDASAFAWGLDHGGAEAENLTYARAFDGEGFHYRAVRKMTQAEWGLYRNFRTICPRNCTTTNANESGVSFVYYYNIALPWFGYLWGEYLTIGNRPGWYDPIPREHTFPALPMPE